MARKREGDQRGPAHMVFLFSAVIKQSACHCGKVNRLTFKYTVVSGAPPLALGDASRLQEKADQHLRVGVFKSLCSPSVNPRFLMSCCEFFLSLSLQ